MSNSAAEYLFKNAPEGTTHFGPEKGSFVETWFKIDSGIHEYMCVDENHGWRAYQGGIQQERMDMLIARPVQTTQWSGPQDGLPPVGTVCELRHGSGGWGFAEIKYISEDVCVWLWVRPDALVRQVEHSAVTSNMEFRAIKTKEQHADEQRETAIREIMDVAGIDCLVTATKLVDAGLKREVV